MNSSAPASRYDYRPDIDGLRAIAVLAVILFHINKRLLPGGFVGVDIFFVVSGFLISLHILRDIDLGQFSIVEFYRRRVKRIALPLLLVVCTTVVAAQLLMLPEDARQTSDSALYSLLSIANVYFWLFQDTSYFAADSAQTPLLHLWTLGIEEQFYILWPLLLILLYRPACSWMFFAVAGAAMLASFVFGQVWFQHDPAFVYYMLPSRAGELLMGALLALAVLRGIEKNIPARAVLPLAVIGLFLIVLSMLALDEDQVFPGMRAIVPTFGAALLILAGHCARNRVSSLLELKPLAFIGLLSYSAYLWHWPLLAFYRYTHAEVGLLAAAAISGLTLLLAWLTYLLIERPARSSQAPALKVLVMQYCIPAYLVGCIALSVIYLDGFNIRWKTLGADIYASAGVEIPEEMEILAESQLRKNADERQVADPFILDPRFTTRYEKPRAAYQFHYVCQRERAAPADLANANCIVGDDSTSPPKVLLWGDSNAAHYVGVIGEIARQSGFRFRNVEVESCPPLSGDPEPFIVAKRVDDCRASMEFMQPELRAAEVIIIAASWSDYAGRSGRFFERLFASIKELTAAGKYVVIMAKAPEITGYRWDCVEKARASATTSDCPYLAPPGHHIQVVNARLKEFAEHNDNVGYFDVFPYLCNGGGCSAFDEDGFPLYYDAAHLSMQGSWKLGEKILHKDGLPIPFARIVTHLQRPKAGD